MIKDCLQEGVNCESILCIELAYKLDGHIHTYRNYATVNSVITKHHYSHLRNIIFTFIMFILKKEEIKQKLMNPSL